MGGRGPTELDGAWTAGRKILLPLLSTNWTQDAGRNVNNLSKKEIHTWRPGSGITDKKNHFLKQFCGTVDKNPPASQGTRVRSLVWVESICHGQLKPVCHNC